MDLHVHNAKNTKIEVLNYLSICRLSAFIINFFEFVIKFCETFNEICNKVLLNRFFEFINFYLMLFKSQWVVESWILRSSYVVCNRYWSVLFGVWGKPSPQVNEGKTLRRVYRIDALQVRRVFLSSTLVAKFHS